MKITVHKEAVYTGHRDCIYSLEKKNNNEFYASGADGLVVEWDLKNPNHGKLVAQVKNSVYSLTFNPLTNYLYICQNFEGIHVIDTLNNKEIKNLQIGEYSFFDSQIVDNLLFVAASNGTLYVINAETLTFNQEIKLCNSSLRSIAISKDFIAVGSSDSMIYIIERKTLKILNRLEAHTKSVFTIQFSPNQELFSSGRDAHLLKWTYFDFEISQNVVAHMFAINHIVFSPDAMYFATCSMDKSIKIWETESCKLLKVIDKARHAGHGTSINKLLWVNDILISCSDDRSIVIWKIEIDRTENY